MKLDSVHLPNRPPNSLWDVTINSNTITSISSCQSSATLTSTHPVLIPSLCHPHIHLDKPFLLSSPHCHSRYLDLVPTSGTFREALTNTSKAKARYDHDDLHLRGSQLIAESVTAGVTGIRAFVEVDHVTKCLPLEVGIELKKKFETLCILQLVAFAQDPIFSTDDGEENRRLLTQALESYGNDIDVLGTTPYVEHDQEASLKNIEWAIDTALKHKLHLDFHLDYNLDATKSAMVWDVLRLLREMDWTGRAEKGKTIVLGHCTRLTMFSDEALRGLADEIRTSDLPVSFVGLPTSDLFMMGRPSTDEAGGQRPRGTLQVLDFINKYGLNVCLGVNNVGNAFTPWGSLDPLRLASLGVGIYQDGTEKGAEALMACVSWRARKAIGLGEVSTDECAGTAEVNAERSTGPWLLIKNIDEVILGKGASTERIPARQWRTIQDVIWNPPDAAARQIVTGD